MNDNAKTDQRSGTIPGAQLSACGCLDAGECTCPDAVVCLRNVSFAYRSEPVLEHITFCVPRECLVGLIGPNGGGKTTLLKIILGLLEPQSGEAEVFGGPAGQLGTSRGQIGYVPQRLAIASHFPASVRDVVVSGCFGQLGPLGRVPKRRKDRTEELMELTGVKEYADRPIGELSGGEQQRVFIARALVADPMLLIVDEPISGVDTAGQVQFFELVNTLREEFKLTIIMVSHNIGQLVNHADYLGCLNKTMHWHNPKEGVDIDLIEQVYGCELRAHLDHYRRKGE